MGFSLQEGVLEDCHRHRHRVRHHGLHRLLRQAHPHPHQQHHRRIIIDGALQGIIITYQNLMLFDKLNVVSKAHLEL